MLLPRIKGVCTDTEYEVPSKHSSPIRKPQGAWATTYKCQDKGDVNLQAGGVWWSG